MAEYVLLRISWPRFVLELLHDRQRDVCFRLRKFTKLSLPTSFKMSSYL